MNQWKPISEFDFRVLLESQYEELSAQQRELFDKERVSPWTATICRSETAGDERVYVAWERVWQGEKWVLYFDDVEYGFNISTVDARGRITRRRGNQATLEEAVWLWIQPNWKALP